MLLVYNYVLLKMSTWYSKHVDESNNILRINNIQCITLVILCGQFMMHGQRNIKLCWCCQHILLIAFHKLSKTTHCGTCYQALLCSMCRKTPDINYSKFHCFTVHFNSLNRIHQLMHFLIFLLVFSPWAGLGTDQSSVRRLVWLWYAAS